MVSFVREKKWTSDSLSVVRRRSDNAGEVCAKWRDHKMSQFLSPEAGTSLNLGRHDVADVEVVIRKSCSFSCTLIMTMNKVHISNQSGSSRSNTFRGEEKTDHESNGSSCAFLPEFQ